MKYRTKYLPGVGYFAQVKTGFFATWKRIGCHVEGFGLYPESSTDYPLETEFDACKLMDAYDKWHQACSGKPQYTYWLRDNK